MLRLLFSSLLFVSCTMGTIKTGGEHSYIYDAQNEYKSEELIALTDKIIETKVREPQVGKLDQLFGKGQAPLKKVGVIIFESEIQPTREGLAGKNKIYLSESGKQIMTENLLSIWNEAFKLMGAEELFVPMSKIKKAKSFHQYGFLEDDFVKTKRSTLEPDDIFFMEPGKKTTTTTVVNPRGARDMAFVLVPAYELMGGPKWSEQNKQFINDVVKELNLDAVVIFMSEIRWTVAHTDKHSGEYFPEEIKMKLKASTLIPLTRYHERLEKIGNKDKPNVTLCYRAYESTLNIPAQIDLPSEKQTFDAITKEVLTPAFKSYKDLTYMMVHKMTEDIKKSW